MALAFSLAWKDLGATHSGINHIGKHIDENGGGVKPTLLLCETIFAERGAEVWLACHERVEAELYAAFPELVSRIRLVRDTRIQKVAFRYGKALPYRIDDIFVGQVVHFSTQVRLRKIAIELARANKIDVVFEPAPITPKGLSFMYDVGVPVVIGPLVRRHELSSGFRGS
jgi:hypothetical protein